MLDSTSIQVPNPAESTDNPSAPVITGNVFNAMATYIQHASPGERAALARLNPDQALRPHEIAALARVLLAAGLQPDTWRPATWQRWALIAHGMALAGHDGAGRLGWQLAQAGVAESRVTKLLTARGDAFTQLLPRVLRLLASKSVRPNWHELGSLGSKKAAPNAKLHSRPKTYACASPGPTFLPNPKTKKPCKPRTASASSYQKRCIPHSERHLPLAQETP